MVNHKYSIEILIEKKNHEKLFNLKNHYSNDVSLSPKPDKWEIDRNELQISEILGEGNFGQVAKGNLKGREKPVAVKMLLGKLFFNLKVKNFQIYPFIYSFLFRI